MPVEPGDAAERLEPDRIGHTPDKFAGSEFHDDEGGDSARKLLHPAEKPGGAFP